MIRTEVVDSLKPGPEVWREILWSAKVGAISCAGYESHPHRTLSNNRNRVLHLVDVDEGLKGSYFPDLGSIFAVSSLVALNRFGAGVYGEGVDYFYDEPWLHTVPLSLLGIDFDCPNNRENARFISTKLEVIPGDWSLLDTGGSYHWVFHHPVPPEHAPFHYGRILKVFASTTDETSAKFFNRVGTWLERGWNDWKVVRWVVGEMLDQVRHWDEVDRTGPYTYPDARYIAHSLKELDRFLKFRESGFGYLRVGPKEQGGPAPVLIAGRRGRDVVIYESAGSTV